MKASELRIGNYISLGAYIYDNWYEVAGDNLAEFADEGCDPYKPIPLTEEWLVKFGFKDDEPHYKLTLRKEQSNDYHYLHEWQLLFDQYSKTFTLFIKGLGSAGKIDKERLLYVHQLQNLYFALTGEELTLKES